MSQIACHAPSGQTIMWSMNGTKLAIQNHTVVISEYVECVHSSLLALASKVDTDILFEVQFLPGTFDLPSYTLETNDLKTLGSVYSLSTWIQTWRIIQLVISFNSFASKANFVYDMGMGSSGMPYVSMSGFLLSVKFGAKH